ncbi:MAG: DUF2312 domain-containing protein [Pseudomonadota bacterium]
MVDTAVQGTAEAQDGISGGENATAARLRSFIERIERLEEEKAALMADIREVYAEAKGNGFDVKTMRQLVRLRRQEPHERNEQEALLETYKAALGMG